MCERPDQTCVPCDLQPQHKLINAFAQTEVNLEATTLVHCQVSQNVCLTVGWSECVLNCLCIRIREFI